MTDSSLSPIDWSTDTYSVTESSSVDLTSDHTPDRSNLIKNIAKLFEMNQQSPHYVYCFSFDDGNRWYVGETSNLEQRISTHLREKDVTNIECVETVPDKDKGLERERELSYEVAIEKGSTEIYGGR